MFGKPGRYIVTAFSLILMVLLSGAVNLNRQNHVLIKFRQDAQTTQVDSLVKSLGLTKVKSIAQIRVDVFDVGSKQSVSEVVRVCSALPFVEYAEPSATYRTQSIGMESAETAEPAMAVQAETAEFREGQILIKFKSAISDITINSTLTNANIAVVERINKIGVLKCSVGNQDVMHAVEACRNDPNIEYAEPNYIYRASIVPNDPRYSSLYGMDIIQAPAAWDVQTGSATVVVGVVDTGVDLDHEDLKNNIWTNPDEIPGNGVDDDGNGFVDDINGWDFVNNDNNPRDDHDHGTHCSGTAGAEGNNGKGVVGVSWDVSIMALKFLAANGSGSTDDAISAIIYAADKGANILSNSWGGGGRSQALEDAIAYARDKGVLFVAAAGNNSSNNDAVPNYPSNYDVENVIAVASSNSSDGLSSFSNYGRTTVHLAAPGSNIVSSVRNDIYREFSGTSMATPHVSGAAALVWSQYPGLTWQQVKTRVLGGVDRSATFSDITTTGGRLNVNKSLSTDPVLVTDRLQNTLDETGPYVVNSEIVDDGSIQSAVLTYQVMGQSAVTVNMTSPGGDSWTGDIPGQALGSTITYFVKATDNDGNMTQDTNFSFQIAEPPPTGGCCGKPALEFTWGGDGTQTALNAAANVLFFLLPVALIRRLKRKK